MLHLASVKTAIMFECFKTNTGRSGKPIRILVLAFSVAATLVGQIPPPAALTAHPEPDSHSLYGAFTRFHATQISLHSELHSKDPKAADDLKSRVSQQYRVNRLELDRIEAITLKTQQRLADLEQATSELYKNKKLSPGEMRQAVLRIEAQRNLIEIWSMNELRRNLSTSSWAGLQSFVNQEIRSTVLTVPKK